MDRKKANKLARKAYLLDRQGGKCAYCQCPLNMYTATLDHVVPKCMGGGATRENQVAACKPCNGKKADKPPHVFHALLMSGLIA